jgi:arsenate reductase
MKGLLFLCVANSARSQMAEGIARSMLPPRVGVWSAGSKPTAVRPEAIVVMGEIGIDISEQRAKGIDAVPLDRIDTIVTLCGGNACPVLPGTTRSLHWEIPDPVALEGQAAARLEAFRSARDELRSHIAELVAAG